MGDPDWYKNRPSAQPAKKLEYPMIEQDPPPPKAPALDGVLGETPGWVHVGFPAVGVFQVQFAGNADGKSFTGFVATAKGTAVTPSYAEAAEALEAALGVFAGLGDQS